MSLHRAHLADLDELALVVREPTSRAYILEAIADYRAGSYRSAIVATWTAICFDIVAKFRELAANGDAAAKEFVSTVDKAIAQPKNPEMFLAIERQLLDESAKSGFIGHREQIDLDRVKEDRNYCAHPAFIADAALFQPTADQSRAHIVHAVEHLLRHAPVEGKTAITRFIAELTGAAFPPTDAAVEAWLKARYSGHVKASTLRSIIVTTAKGALRLAADNLRARSLAVLRAMQRGQHQVYQDALKDQLPKLLAAEDERTLPRLAGLVAQDRSVLGWLGEGFIAKLQGAIAEYPMDNTENRELFALAEMPEFIDAAQNRFAALDSAERSAVIVEHPSRVFVQVAIAEYAESRSYRGAEARGEIVLALARKLEPLDISKVLKAASENPQIWDASGTPDILARLFAHTIHHVQVTGPMWAEFLVQMYQKREWADPATTFSAIRDGLVANGFAVPTVPSSAD